MGVLHRTTGPYLTCGHHCRLSCLPRPQASQWTPAVQDSEKMQVAHFILSFVVDRDSCVHFNANPVLVVRPMRREVQSIVVLFDLTFIFFKLGQQRFRNRPPLLTEGWFVGHASG